MIARTCRTLALHSWKTIILLMCTVDGALAIVAALAPQAAAWADPAERTFHVAIGAGRLTVKADDVPLDRILEEIARQTGLTIHSRSLTARNRVSVDFRDLTLEAGLTQVLRGCDYAFVFSDSPSGKSYSRPRVTEVLVFADAEASSRQTNAAPTRGRVTQPERLWDVAHDSSSYQSGPGAPTRDQAVVSALLQSVQESDQSMRLAAIRALSSWGTAAPIDTLVAIGLAHEDPQTRLALLNSGLPLRPEVLAFHALYDAERAVRDEALLQITASNVGAAEEFVRDALKHPDPAIQSVAQRLLERMDATRAR